MRELEERIEGLENQLSSPSLGLEKQVQLRSDRAMCQEILEEAHQALRPFLAERDRQDEVRRRERLEQHLEGLIAEMQPLNDRTREQVEVLRPALVECATQCLNVRKQQVELLEEYRRIERELGPKSSESPGQLLPADPER